MAVDIVGSKMKSQTARGQNNDQTGSFTREKSLPIIPNVAPPNAGTPNANTADDSKRLGEIMGHPIAHHDGLPPRTVSDGSPGGKVPSANIRRSRTDGIGRPVKR
ncbi:hypothetical protein [Bradyrhizobium sp. 27S5]|uniref:hypothetical protein n=1 Tax=Bradyrhizobium sp. 27S5 TaxID=3139728 RepID=UPI0030D38CD0